MTVICVRQEPGQVQAFQNCYLQGMGMSWEGLGGEGGGGLTLLRASSACPPFLPSSASLLGIYSEMRSRSPRAHVLTGEISHKPVYK